MRDPSPSVGAACRDVTKLALAVVALLVTGCAKRGMPEGGPPDIAPPEIVRTIPATGAVNVPCSATVMIEFSELVNRTTLTPDLSVSPPLAGAPEVKWSGRIASLRWADSLRPNLTYRFVFGSKLSDMHSNRLKEPVTLAFSTGTRIDSCRIRGEIWTPEPVSTGLSILAYQIDSSRVWPPERADFVTQAGLGGQFDLPYLPPGLYRVLAVGDRNRNGRPDQTELLGIAVADIDLRTRTVADGVRLFARPLDTTAFRLDGCSQAADGSILVGLTHPADTSGWIGSGFLVKDSASGELLPVTVLRPIPPKFAIIPIFSDGLVTGHSYEVVSRAPERGVSRGPSDLSGAPLLADSCRVSWGPIADTTGPRVSWTVLPLAENATSASSPFQIGFNEPLDTVASQDVLLVRDTLGHDLAGVKRWIDPRHLIFTPTPSWPESVLVVVASLDSTRLFDRYGHLGPPQPHLWKFRPLRPSQMGAVSGRIEISDSAWATSPCHVEARPAGKGPSVSQAMEKSGAFELNLPSGRWILDGFIDLDRDGRWSGGQLQPFKPAEPRTINHDTVTVRARFTLDDVVIRF